MSYARNISRDAAAAAVNLYLCLNFGPSRGAVLAGACLRFIIVSSLSLEGARINERKFGEVCAND